MKAVKIKIDDTFFLLPDDFDYEFPTYITEHLEQIRELIFLSTEMTDNVIKLLTEDTSELELRVKQANLKLAEFKKNTGIIGFPFDMHDATLYALDRNIDVVLEVDLSN